MCYLGALPLSDEDRIIGGYSAVEGQFPHQVSLRKSGKHFCGGSIIGSLWVLTAAQCIYNLTGGTFTVAFGSVHLFKQSQVDVAGAWYHESFNPQQLHNDIALVKLTQPVSGNIQAIGFGDAGAGDILTLSGWGLDGIGPPEVLQYISLQAIDSRQCAQYWIGVNNSQICTSSAPGHGPCQGDTGGPLIYNDVQVGIASFSKNCALGVPDVFTRVSACQDWIQRTMQEMG